MRHLTPWPALLALLFALGTPAQARLGGDFTLSDHDGAPFSLEQARGQVVLLFFGYTHCPDICLTTLGEVTAALHRLGELADRVRPLFVSVDPERDTPAVLRNYVGWFDPRITALTGSPDAIRAVADQYRVRYSFGPRETSGFYPVDHSADLYVIDTDGRLVRKLPYGIPPETIAETVRTLLRRAGAPDAARR